MSPKYTVYVRRWEVYRVLHVEARSEEEAQELGCERYETTTEYDHTEGGYDTIEAELEED